MSQLMTVCIFSFLGLTYHLFTGSGLYNSTALCVDYGRHPPSLEKISISNSSPNLQKYFRKSVMCLLAFKPDRYAIASK